MSILEFQNRGPLFSIAGPVAAQQRWHLLKRGNAQLICGFFNIFVPPYLNRVTYSSYGSHSVRFVLAIAQTNFTSHFAMQERREAARPWSIGSQLLGHYDLAPRDGGVLPAANDSMPHLQSCIVTNTNRSHSSPPYLSDTWARQNGTILPYPGNCDTASDDQDPRPLLRASTTFYNRVITDWWWWELFSWVISFCCTAAIIVVLLIYNDKKQPQYIIPGITMNAYIAVFAAISKAALILPVSEAIGQLKWTWFQNESRLSNFFVFDAASRGPWGALMLLGRTRCK